MTNQVTHRSCPTCGSASAAPFLEKGGLRVVRCLRCEMVYANPVTPDYATGDYYRHETYYTAEAKLVGDFSLVRYEREVRALRRHIKQGRLLDVGCSSGGFIHALAQMCPGCYQALGVDVSGPALEYARSRGFAVISADFPQHTFPEESFDAVTFWAVLEHLVKPREFLHKAWTILRPGGVCFVLVPNLQSLAVRLLGARYRYILPEHVNYFSRATLRHALLAATEPPLSWEIIECRTTHFNPAVLWQDWRNPGVERSGADRAELLRRTTAWKRSRWSQPLRPMYRLSEGVLGLLNLADNLLCVARRPGEADLVRRTAGGFPPAVL